MLCSLASIGGIRRVGGAAKLSGKVQFNGSNWLSTINTFAIGTSQFTIEFWVKPQTAASGCCFWGAGSNTAGWGIYYNHYSAGGTFSFFNESGVTHNSGFSPTMNTWYHIAVQRNSANRIQIFINGTLVYTSSTTYTANLSFTGGYVFGRSYTNNTSNTCPSGTQITGFRASNIARYSANFTASTDQIQHGTNTYIVFNFKDSSTFLQAENQAYSLTNNGSVTFVSGYP